MPGISLAETIGNLSGNDEWGPEVTTSTMLDGVPYAAYSKGDKLGRMADWTQEGKEGRDRGGRQFGRFRDQQVYGAGTSSVFAIQVAEDESSFSVVDNSRTSTKTRGFSRGGPLTFRGRGQRGATQRGGARGGFQRQNQGRPGQQQNQYYDNRGGRGGRGRRFGWRDYDKPQRNRDASVNIRPDWQMREEIEFSRLNKLNLETSEGEDVDAYGFLYYYDRAYDKPPVKNTERKLQESMDGTAYNVTTSSDPVIQDLADKDEATIFATADILSMLMCATRSVYSWDIVILKHNNKIFLDKRVNSSIDLVTVNENAADAPLEADTSSTPQQNQTGVKADSINTPFNLAQEAQSINHFFPMQVVRSSPDHKLDFDHPNPFHPDDSPDHLASKAYKYRRFDLSLGSDEEPLHLIVRTELDAVVKNNISGEDQYLTIKALNEFDHKAQGAGGALDWRTKLTSQRGAVVATEMKNNSCKLARWTTQAILAKADQMKLGFVSRANPKSSQSHVILGVVGYKPREFASQMNLGLNNGWGIVRTIVDLVMKMSEADGGAGDDEGATAGGKSGDKKYVLVKDPNKSVVRLYEVPLGTFEEDGDDGLDLGAGGRGGGGDDGDDDDDDDEE